MSDAHVPFSQSVLKRLIKNLVIIYILVTLAATLIHIWIGFVNTRGEVRENLTAFHQMFQPILREGLYRFDAERWRSTVRGMLMSPFLTGIRIENEFGEVIELAGTVEIEPGVSDFVAVESRADVLSQKPRFFTRLYREEFGVDYDGVYVGHATLYSCDTVVWSEVWRDFGGILLSALLTTVALWTGLIWIGRRLLSRPLTDLTRAVRALDPDHPETTGAIDVAGESEDEIRVLQDAFNAMVARLERSLREREAAEAENRRLVAAIEQSGEMVLVTDPEGRILYANPALEHSTGYDREELVGATLARFQPEEEGDRRLLAAVAEGRTFMERQVHRKRDGVAFQVRVKASPVRDSSGRMTHVVVVQHDLTHELGLEAQLRHAQKLEAVGTLAGGIAHDFNNILFSILLNAELVLKRLPGDDPARRCSEGILQSAHRGRELVRRILTFSRRDGEPGAPSRRFSLDSIVQESLKLLRATLPASIRIETDMEPDCPPILGDPDAVHQVLINLCTNAYQAMGNGGGVLTVGIRRETVSPGEGDLAPGPYLRLWVADKGVGIPTENLSRVFEPYFTTKPPGEGTGLGLSVVHGIVRSHGGDIVARNREEGGAEFAVRFPVTEADQPETESESGGTEGWGDSPLPAGNRERLMVVDDEPALTTVLESHLIELGYRVRSFNDPLQALAAFEADPDAVDAVICDLTMPEMDGLELSTRMRAVRTELPVILCTGFVGGVDAEALRRAGVSVLLLKPAPAGHLADVVRRVLRGAADPEEPSIPSLPAAG
jgi:PAS domain S-box-containing protein